MSTEESLEKKIIEYLRDNPGTKGRVIAQEIGIEKQKVNSLLYNNLQNKCWQDKNYRWFLAEHKQEKDNSKIKKRNNPLAKLCNYYLDCINEDGGLKVSVFADSKYGLDYEEVDNLPLSAKDIDSILNLSAVQKLVQEVKRNKSSILYFGYPVVLVNARSKSGWKGSFLKPLFLFPININNSDGGANIDLNSPAINWDAVSKFSSSSNKDLIKEIILLEEELGIYNEEGAPDLDELAQRLKRIRPEWQWEEDVKPYNLNKKPPLKDANKEGIYNRGVILKTERSSSKYTRGLEAELNKLSKISKDKYKNTALGKWTYRNIGKSNKRNNESLLEVLPANLEQRQAIQSSLTEELTVITGPPGTGKSQVVTNLLINCAWQGKRVLFASKNNKAVDVVEERINNLETRPVLLRLGSRNNYQEKLVKHISNLLSTSVDEEEQQKFEKLKEKFEEINNKLLEIDEDINEVINLRNKVDELDRKIEQLRNEFSSTQFYQIKEIQNKIIYNDLERFKKKLSDCIKTRKTFFSKLLHFLKRRNKYKDLNKEIGDLKSILNKFNIGLPSGEIAKENKEKWREFLKEFDEKFENIKQIKDYFNLLKNLQENKSLEELTKKRLDILDEMSDKSTSLWSLWLKIQAGELSQLDRSALSKYKSTLQMVTSTENPSKRVWASYYSQSKKISHILPAWAVTSLSAKGRIPFNAGVFDLVIFDEASQCDIASALPLLYRAKRAVVIGDPKQLSHISSINKKQDQKLLEKNNLLESYTDWAYSYNSLFDLASGLSKGDSLIDLRDHYRSHSEIIKFSNTEFYEGRLRIATRHNSLKRPKGEKAGLRWVNVQGYVKKPASGSGSINKEEAKKVVNELYRLKNQNYQGSIGVVTPFRGQANLIRRMVNNEGELNNWLIGAEFLSDTVHKFQGDERDLMIFSPVISKGMSKGSVAFLKKTGNLFNVAITRARAMLLVIGNKQAVLESEISYMSNFAEYINQIEKEKRNKENFINYDNLGPEYPTVSNPESVSEWEKVLYQNLYKAGIKAIPQYQVGMYILDFAVFDEDSNRKLNIEVDGEHYHKDWTGELCYRDQIRNQRMFERGWDVKRFWVYEIRDDMDHCVEEIKNWINEDKNS